MVMCCLSCLECNSWETLEFGGLLGNASRYGHSVVLEPGSQSPVVFGGYLGVLRRDLLLLNTSSEIQHTHLHCIIYNVP